MMGAAAFTAALLLQAGAVAADTAPAPRQYVSGFCAPIVMSDADTGPLKQHYSDWGAKTASEEAAQAFRPQDADAPGQMVSFPAADAPHAFVERRHGACSLVYPGAHATPALIDELKTATLSLGGPNARPGGWRRISTKRVGRPGPIRYFLAASEEARFGLCATLFEDLRLHDETAATLVRVDTCRIGADDTLD